MYGRTQRASSASDDCGQGRAPSTNAATRGRRWSRGGACRLSASTRRSRYGATGCSHSPVAQEPPQETHQCEERPGLFGFQGHLLESAVKPMGVNGHLAVRVPQDSSPYPPHIQFAQRHYSGEHAGDYALRTGSVAELVAMPTEVLQGARVVGRI